MSIFPISFNIFPVGSSKAPLISGWQTNATRDPRILARWTANGAQAWGIPCGIENDLFVIDLDVDKETGTAAGVASLIAQPRYAGLLAHATVTTPSGGRHIYCRHFEGSRNSTSKIGKMIDTRGEGGYVIAPGSIIQQGTYSGSIPDTLPLVPIGLRAMLLHTHPTPTRTFDRITPKGEIEELLSYIPADLPYHDWVAVLMALHHRFNGSEEGLAFADRWSASGHKYRRGEVAAKWLSFKGCGISWATIPALARQHGANLSHIAQRWSACQWSTLN